MTGHTRRGSGSLGIHGGDLHAHPLHKRCNPENYIDFSGNTHVFAADITEKLVRDTPCSVASYPDTCCRELCKIIAKHEGLSSDCILPGNGSADLIWLTMHALSPRRTLFIGPIPSEYVRACAALNIPYEIVTPPPESEFVCGPAELRRIWDSSADLAVFCTPNNPGAVTYPNIQALLEVLRVPRVLADNTYREFLWDEPEYADNSLLRYRCWLRPGVTLLSLCTFSNFFACPGLRLGYLVGDPKQLRHIARIQPPWSVNPYAQLMGRILMEHLDEYRERLVPMRAARTSMARNLRRLTCFDPAQVFEGASFITAGLTPKINTADVCAALAKHHLLIQDCTGIPGIPPGYVRVQVRSSLHNEELLKTLDWHNDHGW